MRAVAVAVTLLGAGLAGCSKVPLSDVEADFTLADTAWFQAEETLFVFYRITAEQGLGDPSVVEITYTTDDGRVDWTPLSELTPVHTHVDVDCGTQGLCGSHSVHVPLEPRDVDLRLRYHHDGELSLRADTVLNVIYPGPAHLQRSLLVYGVFDETNRRVQWRARHLFPTLRNQDAEDLGLRREFSVADQRYGDLDEPVDLNNPYAYGVTCPGDFVDAGVDPVLTLDRAVFNAQELPTDAADAAVVCGPSTVTDALGNFTADAVARKNPEVRPAFPLLRTPVRDATPLRFFLAPCDRTIDDDHEELQRQRLLVGDLAPICTDDWETAGFVEALVTTFSDAVEAERVRGQDMVLVIGLHRDDDGLADAVQEALALVVPEERHQSSPRLAGAFVFDSDIQGLTLPELEPVTLWCPATQGSGASARTCAIQPDNPEIELGPLTFSTLPVFPSRAVYLDFIDTYSKRQAGDVLALDFLTPEFATTSDHIDLGEFGTITFLDDEFITATADEAFSHCVQEEPPPVVFRSEILTSEQFANILEVWCANGVVSEDFCSLATLGVLTLDQLPEWHELVGEPLYELGLFWDFPFLLRVEYEAYTAGAVSAFELSVPFGVAGDGEAYYGTAAWLADAFSLEDELLQCTRFCDHPTFGSASVYNVTDPFRLTYLNTCYAPVYPRVGDSGFPLDP